MEDNRYNVAFKTKNIYFDIQKSDINTNLFHTPKAIKIRLTKLRGIFHLKSTLTKILNWTFFQWQVQFQSIDTIIGG